MKYLDKKKYTDNNEFQIEQNKLLSKHNNTLIRIEKSAIAIATLSLLIAILGAIISYVNFSKTNEINQKTLKIINIKENIKDSKQELQYKLDLKKRFYKSKNKLEPILWERIHGLCTQNKNLDYPSNEYIELKTTLDLFTSYSDYKKGIAYALGLEYQSNNLLDNNIYKKLDKLKINHVYREWGLAVKLGFAGKLWEKNVAFSPETMLLHYEQALKSIIGILILEELLNSSEDMMLINEGSLKENKDMILKDFNYQIKAFITNEETKKFYFPTINCRKSISQAIRNSRNLINNLPVNIKSNSK